MPAAQYERCERNSWIRRHIELARVGGNGELALPSHFVWARVTVNYHIPFLPFGNAMLWLALDAINSIAVSGCHAHGSA